jgi:hypothetical protein
MADFVFIAIALAFFGLAYLYVLGCDRIIGRESPGTGSTADAAGHGDAPDGAHVVVRS